MWKDVKSGDLCKLAEPCRVDENCGQSVENAGGRTAATKQRGPACRDTQSQREVLRQVCGQGSLKCVLPREPLPERGCDLLDRRVDAVPVVLPGR